MCMALQQSKLNVHKFTEGQGSGTAITQCWTHMVLGSCSWISLYPPSTHMAEFQAGWGWECHLSFLSRSLRGKKKQNETQKTYTISSYFEVLIPNQKFLEGLAPWYNSNALVKTGLIPHNDCSSNSDQDSLKYTQQARGCQTSWWDR